jgi:hypothetical protein
MIRTTSSCGLYTVWLCGWVRLWDVGTPLVSFLQARFHQYYKSRGYGFDHLLHGRSFVRVGFESYYATLEVPIHHNLILNLELNLDLAYHRYQPRDSHLKGSLLPRPPPSSRTRFRDPVPVRHPSSSTSSQPLSCRDRAQYSYRPSPPRTAQSLFPTRRPTRPLVSHLTFINLVLSVFVRSSFSGFGNGYNYEFISTTFRTTRRPMKMDTMRGARGSICLFDVQGPPRSVKRTTGLLETTPSVQEFRTGRMLQIS